MKLTTSEISFLANIFEQKTPIGLFSNINQPHSENEKMSLEQKGILKDGKLTDASSEILGIVANAEKCSRIVLGDGICIMEKYTYKTGDKLVLVENDGGDMSFSIIDDSSKVLYEISEFTGASQLKNCDISELFEAKEMLVLFAIIDIYRKNSIYSYVGQTMPTEPIKLEQIVTQLKNPFKNSIVLMLKNNYNYKCPSDDEINKAVEGLIKKNCITENGGYVLTFEYTIFAKGFLMPEITIILEALNMFGDDIVTLSGLCVCSGIKDIVSFIFNQDDIEINTLCGRELLEIAEKFLECPELV